MNDLADAIRAALPPEGRPSGDGWYTLAELAVKFQRDRSAMQRYVRKYAKEQHRGTIVDPSGRRRQVWFYR